MSCKELSYTVYKHIFPNRKVYIGVTSLDVRDRWGKNGSGYRGQPLMENAIKKYGWDSIIHEIVAYNLTEEEASRLEQILIKEYNSTDIRFGYNIAHGGINTPPLVSAKSVICLNSLKIYSSAKEASLDTGANPSSISKVCKGTRKTAGIDIVTKDPLIWEFYDPNKPYLHKIDPITIARKLGRKIIRCVETCQEFPSAKEASRVLGINRKSITDSCRTGYACFGRHFEYVT